MQLSLFHLIIIFVVEVIVLYKLSHLLIQNIGHKVTNLTHSRRTTMYVLALLFLPGTLLHELSHWVFARILMVPTGEVVLWPRMEPEGFRLGSVAIARTDTLRRFVIGAAPFLGGIILTFGVLWYITGQNQVLWWQYVLAGYTVFEIGNTMFSSKKDLEGSTIAVILIISIFIALYLMGVTIPIDVTVQLGEVITNTIVFLLVPIGIDLALVLIAKLL